MGKREIVVYHRSKDGKNLVEVARYKLFGWVKTWAKNHPNAIVFAKIEVEGLPVAWWEFQSEWDRKNNKPVRLAEKDIDRLPEQLNSK